jgi:DNA-binding NarL/FixJ family response regulator
MRCLVVDDHESVRVGVAAILATRANIEVCGEASNGQEAIEIARELKPDLIIMDVNMPVLDGIHSAKEIKTFLPDVPILFFSMHDGIYLVHEAKMAGVQGFVSKTDARATLLDAVDAVVNKQTYFPDRSTSPRTRNSA